ncbi:hypothetical protein LTR84_008997 [Exophiala bonariae]|uniref:Dicer-like protein 2 n=1 Tax=Exophiala bonariae TaxID=1690606 RepID=A0AAV9MVH8_9EURO|nr:hypothetical protein LTR84_008997 [Exophiala bonariae]
MSSSSDELDAWSDDAVEDDPGSATPIYSRAYQLEMFEHSMRNNIIAVMATGSGKTQVAKLRIHAELERTFGKQIWFTAPSVALVDQQHFVLSHQLPEAQFKMIVGANSPEHWKSRQIWDQALLNVDVVVCTPQILVDALDSGFVSLTDISLIVVDEAHHCFKNNPLNTMMRNHYHTFSGPKCLLPAILGLTASPVTRKSVEELRKLEENLAAKCMTPTKQMDEYTTFVNAPKFQVEAYVQKPCDFPPILAALESVVDSLKIDDDPYFDMLRSREGLGSLNKLEKIIKKGKTPAIEEVQSFHRSAVEVHKTLGPWAAREYITDCVRKVQTASYEALQSSKISEENTSQFICRVLAPLYETIYQAYPGIDDDNDVSEKARALVKLLAAEYHPMARAMIFTRTRPSAWALTKILQAHPLTRQYRAFSFVGCSNSSYRSLFNLAEPLAQNQGLEEFRCGELNLCIATSVMEEGIDVPALNLVICFDEPSNHRSFVQSRGRARQQESKFIMFRDLEDEAVSKLSRWRVLEEEMKVAFAEEEKEDEQRRVEESRDETGGEAFRIPVTGSTLTYENSQQRLQRFCGKISRHTDPAMANPVYIFSRGVSDGVRATVHLPSTLDPALRVFQSNSAWRTERMARRDAAFQAYKSLYNAGLVTDYLIPPDIPREDALQEEDPSIETRDGVYAVSAQYDPWTSVMEMVNTEEPLYFHELQTASPGNEYPIMALLLPRKLERCSFSLFESASQHISVAVSSGRPFPHKFRQIARQISFYLLSTILGRRMRAVGMNDVPLVIIPNIAPERLQDWYDQFTRSAPFVEYVSNSGGHPEDLLLKVVGTNIPYVLQQHANIGATDADGMDVQAIRLSRRLDYLSPQNSNEHQKVAVPESFVPTDCQALSLSAEHGRFMLLIPSMSHMFEVFLRSTEASTGPLSILQLQSLDLLAEALTTPNTNKNNYQRLEFLGDSLLKYYASTQVFVDHPDRPEGILTVYCGRIVANSRLQRATRELGLDRFLTRVRFNGANWTAGVPKQDDSKAKEKTLSSKVLADVIEALIGAAYLDDTVQERREVNVISALKLFIDEIDWKTPAENFARLPVAKSSGAVDRERLQPVERLTGYNFKQPQLLAVALTHSSYNPSISSYDRLEFLGDAVLDHIVKIKLYHNKELLEPDEMTLRRHALVSHATLAFFALQAFHVSTTTDIDVDLATRKHTKMEVHRKVYLADYIRQVDSRDLSKARTKMLSTWDEIHHSITEAFEHGQRFPWEELLRLDAPKSYSDIIESILGAVFIDSGADLEACEQVLETIGYMKLVNRITSARTGDIHTVHPEQELFILAPKYKTQAKKTARSGWKCRVLIDGEHIAHAVRASCKAEAQCKAARRAVKVLMSNKKRKIEVLDTPKRVVDGLDPQE